MHHSAKNVWLAHMVPISRLLAVWEREVKTPNLKPLQPAVSATLECKVRNTQNRKKIRNHPPEQKQKLFRWGLRHVRCWSPTVETPPRPQELCKRKIWQQGSCLFRAQIWTWSQRSTPIQKHQSCPLAQMHSGKLWRRRRWCRSRRR